MLLAHKIELRPTAKQADYLDRACGCRRHCFNQLLGHFKEDGIKWSKKAAYQYYINVIRKEFEWYNEVSSRVTRNAIDDLDNAFKHYFRRVKSGKPYPKSKHKKRYNPYGFPEFKKRGKHDSFALRESPKFDVIGRTLRIEKLKTHIPMRQQLRFVGKTKQVTITKQAGKYFASILVDTLDYDSKLDKQHESVGVDFGVKSLAVLSDGTTFDANQKLKASLTKLKRKQRKLSKKARGSNRYAKAKVAISKLHYHIANQRKAVIHELTDKLTKNYKVICIEDLHVKGMLKNHKLARAISDAGFGMFRTILEAKAVLRGCTVVAINRFFPSTKMCSGCGQLHDMPLNKRQMVCDCGLTLDRDHNAAINIDRNGRDTLQLDKNSYARVVEDAATCSNASMLTV